jgi:hypothetical protein
MLKKLLIGLLVSATFSLASSLLPPKAKESYVMDYTKKTRCLVRNFYVYKQPNWACIEKFYFIVIVP